MKTFFSLFVLLLFPLLAKAETITYDIKQMGLTIGQATLSFGQKAHIEGQDLDLIVFKADSMNFHDEEKIYAEPGIMRPVIIMRDLNIFGSKEKITEHYYPKEGVIKIAKQAKGKNTEQVLKKSGNIDNIYGFIARYRRSGNFQVGDELNVNLPTKDLKIKLMRTTKLGAAGKTFDSFYMQSQPSQYKIWFDAGLGKIPLRISGSMGVSNTALVMKSYRED